MGGNGIVLPLVSLSSFSNVGAFHYGESKGSSGVHQLHTHTPKCISTQRDGRLTSLGVPDGDLDLGRWGAGYRVCVGWWSSWCGGRGGG